MREVVRKSRARTLVAKALPGTGSGKEGSWLIEAEGWAPQMYRSPSGFGWLLGAGLVLRGSELGSKGCNHVVEGGIR